MLNKYVWFYLEGDIRLLRMSSSSRYKHHQDISVIQDQPVDYDLEKYLVMT